MSVTANDLQWWDVEVGWIESVSTMKALRVNWRACATSRLKTFKSQTGNSNYLLVSDHVGRNRDIMPGWGRWSSGLSFSSQWASAVRWQWCITNKYGQLSSTSHIM